MCKAAKGKILLLGGTEDGYILAEKLAQSGLACISSLAGRTHNPRLPAGAYRIGGFTPDGGLPVYIKREHISLIIDATHPYAAQISAKAEAAAAEAAIPYWRLERPNWQKQAGDIWHYAADERQAAAMIPPRARVFLALGRQYLAPFTARADCRFFARMIEPPENMRLPPNWQMLLSRPQEAAAEQKLLQELNITCLICRDSGAHSAYGKLAAARILGLPAILISRPKRQGAEHIFSDTDTVMRYLLKSAH